MTTTVSGSPQPDAAPAPAQPPAGWPSVLPVPLPVPAPSNDAALERAEYFDERKMLIDARTRGYQRVDQMITAGAAGALVLSINFLDKLAPAGATVQWSVLLALGWGALLACLALSLFSHYFSGKSFDCEMARLDARTHGRKEPATRWGTCNNWSTWGSMILIVIGIGFLAAFAFVNAPFRRGESTMTKPTETKVPPTTVKKGEPAWTPPRPPRK
jgi:hypothetical protein